MTPDEIRKIVHAEVARLIAAVDRSEDPLLSAKETARRLGVALNTLRNFELRGVIPASEVHMNRRGWRASQLDAIIAGMRSWHEREGRPKPGYTYGGRRRKQPAGHSNASA